MPISDRSFRFRLIRFVLAWLFAASACPAAWAQAPVPAQPKNDYAKAETWLCRPGRADACAVDLTTTVVAAGGAMTNEKFRAAGDAPIDCFYVYPTVSMQPGANADMAIDAEERGVVKLQFARFASKCRPFAPLYRQMTIAQLRKAIAGEGAGDQAMAYGDVVDAWKYYLQHDNHGRGVVLIGHSQGAGELTRLLQQEFDASRWRNSWSLPSSRHARVRQKGSDVGGTFAAIPLCRKAGRPDVSLYTILPGDEPARRRRADRAQRRSGAGRRLRQSGELRGGSGELKPTLPRTSALRQHAAGAAVGQGRTRRHDTFRHGARHVERRMLEQRACNLSRDQRAPGSGRQARR